MHNIYAHLGLSVIMVSLSRMVHPSAFYPQVAASDTVSTASVLAVGAGMVCTFVWGGAGGGASSSQVAASTVSRVVVSPCGSCRRRLLLDCEASTKERAVHAYPEKQFLRRHFYDANRSTNTRAMLEPSCLSPRKSFLLVLCSRLTTRDSHQFPIYQAPPLSASPPPRCLCCSWGSSSFWRR